MSGITPLNIAKRLVTRSLQQRRLQQRKLLPRGSLLPRGNLLPRGSLLQQRGSLLQQRGSLPSRRRQNRKWLQKAATKRNTILSLTVREMSEIEEEDNGVPCL